MATLHSFRIAVNPMFEQCLRHTHRPAVDRAARPKPLERRSRAEPVAQGVSPGSQSQGGHSSLFLLPSSPGRGGTLRRARATAAPPGLRIAHAREPRAHALGYRLHAPPVLGKGIPRPYWCRSSCARARVASYRHLSEAQKK
jgi:hypothetical protein